MEAIRADKYYTYADYAKWDDDTRYELIDGVAYAMAEPSVSHEAISGELFSQLYNFLKGKPCRVFGASLEVLLNAAGDEDDTVVQPDIKVVCDMSKLDDDKRCNGAPDMVIEILSPSTAKRDKVLKFNKYFQAGVREYWIVDPESRTVSVHVLEGGKYTISAYDETDIVPVHMLEGCAIYLPDVFAG